MGVRVKNFKCWPKGRGIALFEFLGGSGFFQGGRGFSANNFQMSPICKLKTFHE